MNYKKYQNSRNLSWEILIRENIAELPVSIGQISKRLGIVLKHYDGHTGGDGYSTYIRDQPTIFINRNCSKARQRFTAAHELGHILLGHVGVYELVNREPAPTDNPIEHEANVFASRLLAPACVLWGCNAHTPEQIMELCDISYQSACFRSERMKILYHRDKFLLSPLEREVYNQFQEFIKRNRL